VKLNPDKPPSKVRFIGYKGAMWNSTLLTLGKTYEVLKVVNRGTHGHIWIRNNAGLYTSYSARGFKKVK